MTRSSIDFGIYLGTTYSEIAVTNRGQVEAIKSIEGFERHRVGNRRRPVRASVVAPQ